MSDPQPTVPFGAWPSPVTAAKLVEGAAAVGEIRADGDDIWWSEQRPSEGGRCQLVRRTAGGNRHDLFPAWDPDPSAGPMWNARTAVMEYGGGAWGVRNGTVVFANWADQRLYRVDPGGEPTPITPEPVAARGLRWSEPTWLDDGWLVCVLESHEPDVVASHGEATNELVALPLDGSAVDDPTRVRVLVTGADFVHSPAVKDDRVAWIQWDHPRMPWDGTELLLGPVTRDLDGEPVALTEPLLVAGGPEESVVQPGFLADGDLVYCSDWNGWWQPCFLACGQPLPPTSSPGSRVVRRRIDPPWLSAEGPITPLPGALDDLGRQVVTLAAWDGGEIGGPLWVGGLRWWTEIGDGRVVASRTRDGADGLVVIGLDGTLQELATPFSEISQVVAAGDGSSVLVVAGTPVSETAPYLARISAAPGPGDHLDQPATVALELLRPARDLGIGTEWFSRPTHLSFPSAGGRTAHALHYPPVNPEVAGPAGQRPPLVVMIHGGPTSAARNRLDLGKQFWTSRGFAVVDVNYGGSTGYGRPYRKLLDGQWGIVDVEDAVAAARHLADEGLVDPEGLAIRGGSAGGYTTLAALCFHDVFKAGASHFGVADLAALASDTHKFESRYLDGLVGPWPEAAELYVERSPIHRTDGFSAPLIVLQGSEDEVVPPNQAEMIVAALAAKGVPHAYVLFEGEQHGFRQAANIVRALEAELWFYGRVFGFTPADPIEAVEGAVGV